MELLWESEPATLNKIKPLLYIFIIPKRVFNCKCISETQCCHSFLASPPCCLSTTTLATPLSHSSPVTHNHACAHTLTHTFYCVYVQTPLSSLIKGKGLCVCESCVHEEVLLGRGGASPLICNQVRHTAEPHSPLSPPTRLHSFLLYPSIFLLHLFFSLHK